MQLPIYILGQKVLREVAKNIKSDYPKLKELTDSMFETMKDSDGVGLAGPQVGLSINLFVVDLTPLSESEDDKFANYKKIFINSEIIERSKDTISMEEGCLSIPDIHESVARSKKIKVKYMDENFVKHEEEFNEFEARVIQHEYDHLQGHVFIDRISPIRKQMIKSKIVKIIKRKIVPTYKFR